VSEVVGESPEFVWSRIPFRECRASYIHCRNAWA